MDRLDRSLLAFGLGVILAASGCRSPRSDVPPGREYMKDGRQVPAVGFSSDPRHPQNAGFPGGAPGSVQGPSSGFGTANPNMNGYGVTNTGSYGPPAMGTNSQPGSPSSLGVGNPSAGYGGASGAATDSATNPAGYDPLSSLPPVSSGASQLPSAGPASPGVPAAGGPQR
ncbi:MAG TPA: hypothetical protein VGZ22_29975 [Isosphaeraceae bacterium]|nr:hypothetical protein [Isosphaeraceae bacterium]